MIRTLTIERLGAYRRLLPSDVYFWAKAILLAGIAIQLARLLWTLATPVGPFGDWRPAPARLLSAEAQAALIATVDPFVRGPGAQGTAAAAAAAPAVDLQLFGVRASQGSVPGSAILGPADGEQRSFAVGDEVAPGVKLAAVHFDHVVLARGTARQTLHMPGSENGGAGAAGTAGTSRAAAAVGDAFQLAPRNQGGRVTGVTVNPGRSSALFTASGFRPGDVIVAVNGARITSMIDVQQLQSGIAPGARLMLSVERGAETVPIALNVPGNP